jgi:sugar (pentulose or hexulose) kinase
MADRAFIALDLGTSFIKAALVYPQARRVAHLVRRPFPSPLPGRPALYVEVDPAAVTALVRSLLAELAPLAPDCAGVVMCGQMAGLVLTSSTGEALSNYISWRDQRLTLPAPGGGTYFDQLAERLTPEDRRQLGQEVRPGSSLSFLFWLAQARQLPPGGTAYVATLLEFVLAHLCAAPPVMEPTEAIGLLNLETSDWHHGVLAQLGLTGLCWPALADFRTVVGHVAVDGRRLPCYAAVGDQQCALVGAGVGEAELALNISTGSQVSRPTPALALGPYQTRPFFDGRFMNTITHIPAGRALNVLLALVTELGGPADPWPAIHQAAVDVGETDLAVDLAFFPSPVGQRGAITNIHTDNLTVGHLFRAALRNMADNYQTCARRLAPAQDWERLVYSGGLAHHLPLLRELIEARLPGPARVSAVAEDTLAGLLALTLVLSGECATVAAAAGSLRAAPPTIE